MFSKTCFCGQLDRLSVKVYASVRAVPNLVSGLTRSLLGRRFFWNSFFFTCNSVEIIIITTINII
jgi:hypothetical protein